MGRFEEMTNEQVAAKLVAVRARVIEAVVADGDREEPLMLGVIALGVASAAAELVANAKGYSLDENAADIIARRGLVTMRMAIENDTEAADADVEPR